MLHFCTFQFHPFVIQNRNGDQATLSGSLIIVLEAIMSALHIHKYLIEISFWILFDELV